MNRKQRRQQQNKNALPIISPHDIRNAPPGTVSVTAKGDPLTNMIKSVTSEPPSRHVDPTKIKVENRGNPWLDWESEHHYGTLRVYQEGFPITGCKFAVIGISNKDETARHDWREFQQLKNLLVNPEWEAVELYPAESRLIDPSNRFYLWCVPKGVFVFGLVGRNVLDSKQSGAPQRPFPPTPAPAPTPAHENQLPQTEVEPAEGLADADTRA